MHENVKTIFDFFYISGDNVQWVCDQLIDVFESDELGYTLCIHNRDFRPGNLIINNICISIKHSRRLIAIVAR